MTLNPPFAISARLLPALVIGGATISIERISITPDNRDRFQYFIDLIDGKQCSGDDLRSGCGGGSIQSTFVSLLSFIDAFAEAHFYQLRSGRKSENADLFPTELAQWACENSDEISMIRLEIEEARNGSLIIE